MGNRITIFVEDVAGPLDWIEDRSSGHRAFRGRFLIYDREGTLRDYVRGQIAFRDGRTADVYLYDPPAYLSKHRHGRCLQLLTPENRWFRLHFERPAHSFGEAYSFVELLLTEAYCLTH